MSPRLTLVPPRVEGPHRVEVLGQILLGGDPEPHPFSDAAVLVALEGTAPIAGARHAADGLIAGFDARGSVQEDGTLTVTVALQLRHAADREWVDPDAETTVIAAGASAEFGLTCFDAHGCEVRAHGTVANS